MDLSQEMTIPEVVAAYVQHVEANGGARLRDDRADANALYHAALDVLFGFTNEGMTEERFVNSLIDLGEAMVRYAPHAKRFHDSMSAD